MNQYQDGKGATTCKKCIGDTKIDDTGSLAAFHDSPADCSLSGVICQSTERKTEQGTCESCPAGSEVSEQNACRLCPIGKYNAVAGSVCDICDATATTLCSFVAGSISQITDTTEDATDIANIQELKDLSTTTKKENDNAVIEYVTDTSEINTLQSGCDNMAEFQESTGISANGVKIPIYSTLIALCLIIITTHRCFPSYCKNIDIMFAKSHYIQDTHAMRSLDTLLGASLNIVLVLAVFGIFLFIYTEPNTLIIDALVPSTSTSQLDNAGYGTLNIQIKAYAPQNVQCNEIQIPLKGVSSSLTCTSISTPTSNQQHLTICKVNITCSIASNFRGKNGVKLKIPDPFQTLKWNIITSRWSPSINATKISHILTSSNEQTEESLTGESTTTTTTTKTLQLAGTFDAPTVLNFGAIRSVVNDTRASSHGRSDTNTNLNQSSACLIRGIQLLWRETDRKEVTNGNNGFYFIQFQIVVQETYFISTYADRLTESNKLSMVLTYVLSLIGAMKAFKIILQLIIDQSIVVFSECSNSHVPKDVQIRKEILDEHKIEKHEKTLGKYHSHFQSMGVDVGHLFGVVAKKKNTEEEEEEEDVVRVEMVGISKKTKKMETTETKTKKKKITDITNPLAAASNRKKILILETTIQEQRMEINELKRLFQEFKK